MSATMKTTSAPPLAASNITGSLGTTLAGLAAMAPSIIGAVSTFALPATPAGWASIALGILAMFARG